MEVQINYRLELEMDVREAIDFVRDEFMFLFGQKLTFTETDRQIATDLINYLAKLIETPLCLDHLAKALKEIEQIYPTLF
jgi:hypothetical protein